MKAKLLALLLAGLAWGQQAAAQRRPVCLPRPAMYGPAYFVGLGFHHRWSSCADTVERTFRPSRWGVYLGANAFVGPRAGLAGSELEVTYRVSPRVQAGLAGSVAIPTRVGSALGVPEAAKPMLGLYSLGTRANLILLDNPRLRTALITGAGVGVATLADRSQRVVDKGQQTNCGCEPSTHAKVLATSVGLVGLAGASATYKLRPDLWLTAKAYYQQWAGATSFGTQRDLSPWVVSVGITMPDRWAPTAR